MWAAAVPDIGRWPPVLVSCLLGWMLLTIAASELRRGLVPAGLPLLLLAAGLAESALLAPDTLLARVAGSVMGFTAAAVAHIALPSMRERWSAEGAGAGCALMVPAAGAWVSWTGLPAAIFVAVAAALGVLAVRSASGGRVPFATFLCIGTWIVWLHGGTLR